MLTLLMDSDEMKTQEEKTKKKKYKDIYIEVLKKVPRGKCKWGFDSCPCNHHLPQGAVHIITRLRGSDYEGQREIADRMGLCVFLPPPNGL